MHLNGATKLTAPACGVEKSDLPEHLSVCVPFLCVAVVLPPRYLPFAVLCNPQPIVVHCQVEEPHTSGCDPTVERLGDHIGGCPWGCRWPPKSERNPNFLVGAKISMQNHLNFVGVRGTSPPQCASGGPGSQILTVCVPMLVPVPVPVPVVCVCVGG